MSIEWILAFSLVFLLIVFEIIVRFLTMRIQSRARYLEAAEEFCVVARRLVRKGAASDALLDFLAFLNMTLSDASAAKNLYKIAAGNKDKMKRNDFKNAGAFLQLMVDKNASIEERHAVESLFR